MNKPLNMLNNLSESAPIVAGPVGPSTYQARTPRVAFGFAGIAMTAITIAVAVILPAQLDSGKREQPLVLASQTTPSVSGGTDAITRITVVAAREPRPSTAPRRIVGAPPNAEDTGEMVSSAILHISTAAR